MKEKAQRALEGKVAIVTGASSGIGEATAREFARAGAKTVLAARRRQRLEAVAAQIQADGGTALPVPTDITDSAQTAILVRSALDAYGRINVLANIAGWGRYDWIEELSVDDLRRQYDVNIVGIADLIRRVAPIMKAQKAGVIVNMSSYASRIAAPPLTVYASTEYAVEGLSDGLRRELMPWGIAVVRVHPSGVRDTEFNAHAGHQGGIRYRSVPIGRVSRERVAREIVQAALSPRREIFLSRLYDAPAFLNRWFPGVVDAASCAWVRWKRRSELKAAGGARAVHYDGSLFASPGRRCPLGAGGIGGPVLEPDLDRRGPADAASTGTEWQK